MQELEREFTSSRLKNPADQELRQCKFMLSVGGFRLVLLWTYFQKCRCSEARGLSKKNKSEIKHKVLPPTQPWSIAKSSSLPSPPQLPHLQGLKDFWMGVGWDEGGNGLHTELFALLGKPATSSISPSFSLPPSLPLLANTLHSYLHHYNFPDMFSLLG